MMSEIKDGDRIRIAQGMRIDVTDYHGKKKPRDRSKDPLPFGRGEGVVPQPRSKARAYVAEGDGLVMRKAKKQQEFVRGVVVVGKRISAAQAARAVEVGHAELLTKPKAEKAAGAGDGAAT